MKNKTQLRNNKSRETTTMCVTYHFVWFISRSRCRFVRFQPSTRANTQNKGDAFSLIRFFQASSIFLNPNENNCSLHQTLWASMSRGNLFYSRPRVNWIEPQLFNSMNMLFFFLSFFFSFFASIRTQKKKKRKNLNNFIPIFNMLVCEKESDHGACHVQN